MIHEHVKLSPKFSETVKGKLSLGVKVIQEGGRRNIFRNVFGMQEEEKLLKASQCYLYTTAGPIAGILFISTVKVALCSERHICFSSADGESVKAPYKRIVLGEMAADEKNKVVEKKFIHVRINVGGSPLECPETFPSIGRVRVQHRGILLTVKGIVIRSGAIKMHEGERKYMCHKWKTASQFILRWKLETLYHYLQCAHFRNIVLRWIASKLDPSHGKKVLRGLSNCNINKVCPLIFPDAKHVAKGCGNGISNKTACCDAMESYMSHLLKQSFITNLQALGCAETLAMKLKSLKLLMMFIVFVT